MHWAANYIGLPYADTGEGPDAFHCWAFFRLVQGAHYGRVLPLISNPENLLAQVRAVEGHPERERWEEVFTPADGDGVLMSTNKVPVHVGVWVDGDGDPGVLHCARGSGVVFQKLAALKLNGWNVTGFYRFKG